MESALISIIIPVFNRVHLIPETLASVRAQTYTHWECLVIDDGSTDGTQNVVEDLAKIDDRIRFYLRPETHLPGGNGARNFGIEQARGSYIQFFDSDDLMDPQKLASKLAVLQNSPLDFVISKTTFFGGTKRTDYPYDFTSDQIDFTNYAAGPVNWFTYDPLFKREWIGNIRYNEQLKAGQEYNFNCKLLAGRTCKAEIIDQAFTQRREHDASISANRSKERARSLELKFWSQWHTLLDCRELVRDQVFENYSMRQCLWIYFELRNRPQLPPGFMELLKEQFASKTFWFHLARWSNYLTGRYYFFYKRLKLNSP